jgi:hypothetical protein
MIDRNFLDNRPDSHTIKKIPEYRPMEKPPKKLLEQVSDVIRLKHYSYKIEQPNY